MTTLLGYMESYKLRMRVETLESFLKVIRLMETEMRFHALPFKTDYRQILWRYGFIMAMSFIAQNRKKF